MLEARLVAANAELEALKLSKSDSPDVATLRADLARTAEELERQKVRSLPRASPTLQALYLDFEERSRREQADMLQTWQDIGLRHLRESGGASAFPIGLMTQLPAALEARRRRGSSSRGRERVMSSFVA